MEKKAIIAGIILSSVNFTAMADDFMTHFPTPELKSFKIEMPTESAPALTQLYVIMVSSTKVPNGERITPGQISTKKQHQSLHVYAHTVEIGYAKTMIAHINGIELPSSAMINVKSLCVYGGKLDFCGNYGAIVGYLRTWDLSKSGTGNFDYQATSIEYPYDTMKTELYIQ